MSNLKPWPEDAVIIVAETPEGFVYHPAGGHPVKARCRDCGRALVGCSTTRDAALANPFRCGRPIEYLCIPCCTSNYDRSTVGVLIDHRPPASALDVDRRRTDRIMKS